MGNNSEYSKDAIQSTLTWLTHEYQKPLGEQRTHFVIEMSFYSHELICMDPSVHEDIKNYVTNHAVQYTGEPDESSSEPTTKRSPLKKAIGVGVIIALLLLAIQVIASVTDYDLFGNIADWGRVVLNLKEGESLSEDNTTVTKNRESYYTNIQELIDDNNISKLLVPSYLPDDIIIKTIIADNTNEFTIVYLFETPDLAFRIYKDYKDIESLDFSNAVYISGYQCIVYERAGYVCADFVDEGSLYSLKYTDYDELVKIIENLKYVESENR